MHPKMPHLFHCVSATEHPRDLRQRHQKGQTLRGCAQTPGIHGVQWNIGTLFQAFVDLFFPLEMGMTWRLLVFFTTGNGYEIILTIIEMNGDLGH